MNTMNMERELLMREFGDKYGKTKDERVKMDYDEFIEDELRSFRKILKSIKNVRELNKFENWFKLYKALNYDIFTDLNVIKVDKINNYCAAVTLNYKNKTEHDLIRLNPQNLLCEVFRYNDGKVLNRVIRRTLIPANCNEALLYFERGVKENEAKAIIKIFSELNSNSVKEKTVKNNSDSKPKVNNNKTVTETIETNKVEKSIKKNVIKDAAKEVKPVKVSIDTIIDKILSSLTTYERKIWDKHMVTPEYIKIERILERKMLNEIKRLTNNDKLSVISVIKFSRISNSVLRMSEATKYLSKIN